jgi:hypothetical protein
LSFPFSWAPPLVLHIFLFSLLLPVQLLYHYSRTLSIKFWVSVFHSEVLVKFHYFGDITQRLDRGWKRGWLYRTFSCYMFLWMITTLAFFFFFFFKFWKKKDFLITLIFIFYFFCGGCILLLKKRQRWQKWQNGRMAEFVVLWF